MLEKITDSAIHICIIWCLGMIGFMLTIMAMQIATGGVEEAFQRCVVVETKKE